VHIGGRPQQLPPAGRYVHSLPESQTASPHVLGLGFLTSRHCFFGSSGLEGIVVVVEEVVEVDDVVVLVETVEVVVETVDEVVVTVDEVVVTVDEVVGDIVEVIIKVVVVSSGFSVMQPHNKDNVAMNSTYFSVFIFNRLLYSNPLRRLLLTHHIFPLSPFCVVCNVLGL